MIYLAIVAALTLAIYLAAHNTFRFMRDILQMLCYDARLPGEERSHEYDQTPGIAPLSHADTRNKE